MGSEGETDYKVFVGGISWNMSDDNLMDEFKEHGAVKAEIMMDKMTNRSRGFGFVWFQSRAGMQEAINAKHNTEIEGRKISVKEAIPQDQIPPEQRGRDRYRASSYRGGGYERGYGGDRGYGGGYDRGGYGGDYYRDYGYGGYGGYDSRSGGYGGYGGYDSRGSYDRSGYGGYSGGYGDARGYGGSSGYGPERGGSRGYGAPRSAPYDRR